MKFSRDDKELVASQIRWEARRIGVKIGDKEDAYALWDELQRRHPNSLANSMYQMGGDGAIKEVLTLAVRRF